MGILLGGLASLIYGVADFLGGEGAKRVNAASIVLWAGVVSLPLITVVALVVGGEARLPDLWLGAGAGAAGALGLVLLFAGLSRGHAAAVAPSAAVLSGVFPLTVALGSGETLSSLEWAGIVVAVPAIVLCCWVAERGEVPLAGVWYGLFAGLGFGGYTVIIDFTADTSGLLPLVPARAATMLAVLAVTTFGVWRVEGWQAIPKPIVVGNGLLDVAGNIAVLVGLRLGTLARVSIAAAFYPVVTVLLARLVNAERLMFRQIVGLVLSVVALAVIAVG